eukprot:15438733-Alexandrium_andersonii.AAC.1
MAQASTLGRSDDSDQPEVLAGGRLVLLDALVENVGLGLVHEAEVGVRGSAVPHAGVIGPV